MTCTESRVSLSKKQDEQSRGSKKKTGFGSFTQDRARESHFGKFKIGHDQRFKNSDKTNQKVETKRY